MPYAKIVVLERGYLPTGASTKNAGFACFGGAAEILDDLQKTNEETVLRTIRYRWNGLQKLRERIGDSNLEYDPCGSHDLYRAFEKNEYDSIIERLDYLNQFVGEAIGEKKPIYSIQKNSFGFEGVSYLIQNRLDGKINTGKMMKTLVQLAVQEGIIILNGIEVKSTVFSTKQKQLETNYGVIQSKNVLFCTNGLSKRFFPALDVQPARAQVILSNPLPHLKWNGTFHLEQGYYYFRNIGNRILLGGARNKDFEGETTEEITNTELILDHLTHLLKHTIAPNQQVKVEQQWAGIMGVGSEKFPIIRKVEDGVYCAIRLGGMGVAMGSKVGEEIAKLILKNSKCQTA